MVYRLQRTQPDFFRASSAPEKNPSLKSIDQRRMEGIFLLLTNNKYYSLNWIYSALIIYRAECVDKHENCFVFYSKI